MRFIRVHLGAIRQIDKQIDAPSNSSNQPLSVPIRVSKKQTFLKSIGAQGYSDSPDHGEFSGVIFIEIGAGLGGAQRA